MADSTDLAVGAVYSVIQQRPKPGTIQQYEAWLAEIIPVARSFAGHRSVNVIRPADPAAPYTVVLHFDTLDNLRGWLDSGDRARLVAKVKPLLTADENIDIQTGLEFWFTPQAGARRAKPYKQFLVTLSVIFPLTIVVPWTLRPLFAALPPLALPGISHLIVAAIIVGLVTYLIMPHYTKLIAGWLFR